MTVGAGKRSNFTQNQYYRLLKWYYRLRQNCAETKKKSSQTGSTTQYYGLRLKLRQICARREKNGSSSRQHQRGSGWGQAAAQHAQRQQQVKQRAGAG
jgi:hypothetical protein